MVSSLPGCRLLGQKLLTRSVNECCTASQDLDHDLIKCHASTATAGLDGKLAQKLQVLREKNRLKQVAFALDAHEMDDK